MSKANADTSGCDRPGRADQSHWQQRLITRIDSGTCIVRERHPAKGKEDHDEDAGMPDWGDRCAPQFSKIGAAPTRWKTSSPSCLVLGQR